MKLLSATVENFGSYKHLTFDYTDKGLALVYGPTGAGKSTLLDIAPWVLFGITAKDGSVDDVRNWGAEEPTVGKLELEAGGQTILVTRIRGSAKQNDLYWRSIGGSDVRGKDIADTQKLLEDRLGCTADQYLTASYFHEFSKVGTFFTAKAKDRRQVFEEIADLSLAARIASEASNRRKDASKAIQATQGTKDKLEGRIEALNSSYESSKTSQKSWASRHAKDLDAVVINFDNFDAGKESRIAVLKIEARLWEQGKEAVTTKLVNDLTALEAQIQEPSVYEDALKEIDRLLKRAKSGTRCATCQQTKRDDEELDDLEHQRRAIISQQMSNERSRGKFDDLRDTLEAEYAKVNPYPEQVTAAENAENYYAEQYRALDAQANPFDEQVDKIIDDLEEAERGYDKVVNSLACLESEHSNLSQLYDLSSDLRGELLRKTIQEVEAATNDCLTKHFDAELRVKFDMDGDSLDVKVYKNGFDCNFKQLSKGQRQLLRLSFVLAVQKAAANKIGIHFDTLAFDEALDGLDGDLKVKAYGLFEELAKDHAAVLMVDHNESFQNLFATRCRVSLIEDASVVEVENE